MRKILILLVLVAVAVTGFARGRGETELGVGSEDTVYISPNASPGVQDQLTIPISVGDSGRRVVVAYELVVSTSDGTAVWTQSGVDESERPGFFGRLMEGLGLRQRETTVQIPASVDWDGTYLASTAGSDGSFVPDGEYQYVLTITDSSETVSTSDPGVVTVDNTPPTATVSVDNPVFSPDGDGRKDTATITQTSSNETTWAAMLTLDGETILDEDFTGTVSATFTWDGSNLDGTEGDDGVYIYTLSSTDEAGNSFTTDPLSIEIDTVLRPLMLVSDTPAFSPNGDGSKDTVSLSFGSGVIVDGLESATLSVTDSSGTEIGEVEIGSQIAGSVVLTGYLDESGTRVAPEGIYEVSVVATFDNGMVSQAGPLDIEVDVTPPSGSVSASDTIFSPEGDGQKDVVWITQDVDSDATWLAYVYIPGSTVEETLSFGSEVPAALAWDGNDESGQPVPDGTYSYELIGTDAAGNSTTTNAIQVTIDRRETTVDFDLSRHYFSPNGDGEGDTVVVTPVLSVPTGIESFQYRIVDRDGAEILGGSGTGDLPAQIVWDGRGADGTILPEGQYAAVVDLVYEKGNTPRGVSPILTLENTIPTVALRASSSRLTPDGDGTDDTITFIPLVDPIGEIVRFTGSVVGSGGRAVAQVTGVQPLGSVVWDGRGSDGSVVADGYYTAVLEVEHRNGTIRTARTGSIAIGDVTGEAVALRLTPPIFSPDGDGRDDTVLMELDPTEFSQMSSWEINVLAPDGSVFYSAASSDGLVDSVEWDGLNDAGRLVQSATEYSVEYVINGVGGGREAGTVTLTTDILTEERFGGRRITIGDIIFEGYTARYLGWDRQLSAANEAVLDRIAAALEMFPDYDIELDGHAVSLLYYDPERSDLEQEAVLMPLSRTRAEVIADALVARGIDRSRITTEWWGKLRPLVPFSDIAGRWVNRRVEFYLIR